MKGNSNWLAWESWLKKRGWLSWIFRRWLRQIALIQRNPRWEWGDLLPVRAKIGWKRYLALAPHHQTIIPATSRHGSWILGAQPNEQILSEVRVAASKNQEVKYCNNRLGQPLYVVSLLAPHERIITRKSSIVTSGQVTLHRRSWYDHGVLDLTTGKNQTVRDWVAFQKILSRDFRGVAREDDRDRYGEQGGELSSGECGPPIFYCHCMAGRSRSLAATLAFCYLYPWSQELFDWENWPSADVEQLAKLGLIDNLAHSPSFQDLFVWIKDRRPQVKPLNGLDGDQAGWLGLLALHRWANALSDQPQLLQNRNCSRRLADLRDLSLMLLAPLDCGMRDLQDRQEQEHNLAILSRHYQQEGINLMLAMVVANQGELVKVGESNSRVFDYAFYQLTASEQAHFAILLAKLEEQGLGGEPLASAESYARLALAQRQQLTAGDLVELLRTFGNKVTLGYDEVVKRILAQNRRDRYGQNRQLAELHRLINGGSNSTSLEHQTYNLG